jgi:hypothetical protein
MDDTIEAARARYAASGGDLSVIPLGRTCYGRAPERDGMQPLGPNGEPLMTWGIDTCPYWACDRSKPRQISGYCAHLQIGDADEDGPMTLWDMLKACDVNDPDDELGADGCLGFEGEELEGDSLEGVGLLGEELEGTDAGTAAR